MIDWDRVRELRDEIGEDAFGEVVELFLAEVDEAVEHLQAINDPSKLESVLHFLKGSAWNLGFTDFGTLCQSGERLAAAGDPEAVDIEEIVISYSDSRVAFLADPMTDAA